MTGREPQRFFNRELSWLAFNDRVLEEGRDAATPLLERLKFALIVSSNLDEFFMVRVASLKRAVREGNAGRDPAGMTPLEQLERVGHAAHAQAEALHRTLAEDLLPRLGGQGMRLSTPSELPLTGRRWLARFFEEQVAPALTPLAIEPDRPFPLLSGLSLNLGLLLDAADRSEPRFALVQLPAKVPRLVRVAGEGPGSHVLMEEVVRAGLPALFPGQPILSSAIFRVTRDSELELDDEGGAAFVDSVSRELRGRRRSDVVRLEVESGADADLVRRVAEGVGVQEQEIYRLAPPLDPRSLQPLLDLTAPEALRDPPQRPLPLVDLLDAGDLFAVLEERDLLLHHPYDSFEPVVALLTRAAEDPDVLAIKQTLYRTSGDSQIARALARAADHGKQVTVLVELLARFDEWSNIRWAQELERAGAHVVYGVRGYKTHAKVLIIVRRTPSGIRRYVHLATGNYNDRTARQYTDFGLMTTDADVGADASAFFNALTGYSDPPDLKKLVMAPTRLRERIVALIERERRRAQDGQPTGIRAKMNALVDRDVIEALYDAAAAGVPIRLNVRGICCLRPGVPGLSETIDVVSVVDRFLEHARVFCFHNGGDEEVWLSSADWMPRNLDRRIELMFPVPSEAGRRKVLGAFEAMWRDNVKGRRLGPDGSWIRRRPGPGEEAYRAQVDLYREAAEEIHRAQEAVGIVFEPILMPHRKGESP